MVQSIKLFVILGTQKFPFARLIKAVEELVLSGHFQKDEVLIQSTLPGYETSEVNIVNLIPADKFNSLLKDADIIITHAGVNSILSCMKYQKSFLIVPRRKEFGEHVDDHQMEIAEVMSSQYGVLSLLELDNLWEQLQKAVDNRYKPWLNNNRELLSSIEDFLH